MGQYAQAFADNHIDYDTLGDLTDGDLKDLGLTLGHRKRLLKAIQTLAAASQTDDVRSAVPTIAPQAANHEPEVRQITAVFCDLVGSTELSEKLDPEDLRALIDAYRKTCDAAIRTI